MRALLLALLLAPAARASSDMSQPGTGPGTLVTASTLTISGAGTACFTAGAFSINCAAGSVTGSSGTFNDLRLTYGLTAATGSFSGSVTASSMTSLGQIGAVGNVCAGAATSCNQAIVANGKIKIEGTSNTPGSQGFTAGSLNWNIRENSSGDMAVDVWNGSSYSQAFTIKQGAGNVVGIGTASPCSTCTLHVAGGASVTGAFAVASATFTVATTGIVSAPSQPGFSASTGTFITPSGGFSTLNYDTVNFNRNGMIASATGIATVPTGGDGIYLVTCRANFPNNGTGERTVRLVNGGVSVEYARGGQSVASNTLPTLASVTTIRSFAAADTIACQVYQDSTITLNVVGANLEVMKLW